MKNNSKFEPIPLTSLNYASSSSSSVLSHILAQSTPIAPHRTPLLFDVQKQVSAPSYLFSLRENDAPPFKGPGKEARHRMLCGTERIMKECEAVEMIASYKEEGGITMYLGKFLVEKKVILNFNLSERDFLISLITETIDYSAQRDFSAFKLACLITIYLSSHTYFKWYYWLPPSKLWDYFTGLMIRHSTEDSPDGQLIFASEESFDILSHFHSVYICNLPLIHIMAFGSHRLKFLWPFNVRGK